MSISTPFPPPNTNPHMHISKGNWGQEEGLSGELQQDKLKVNRFPREAETRSGLAFPGMEVSWKCPRPHFFPVPKGHPSSGGVERRQEIWVQFPALPSAGALHHTKSADLEVARLV